MKINRTSIHRPQAPAAAAPAWIVTYADLVTLLLCVFIAILSMSTINKDRFQTALASLEGTFGAAGASDAIAPAGLTLYGSLKNLAAQDKSVPATPTNDDEPEGNRVNVEQTPRGAIVRLAGPTVFERGSGELTQSAQQTVRHVASILRERNIHAVTIRGHCAGESPTAGEDLRDLSYARAATAARLLELSGVSREVIGVVAMGDGRPLLDHAYTEKRRAMNRRVEIEIIESDGMGDSIRPVQIEKG